MHDVCIIYSRKDEHLLPALEKALSPGWSVWWDRTVTGDFRSAIEAAIKAAKCVIPIWSSASRQSQIVIDEANLAAQNNIPLLPIMVEKLVTPPLGFGSIDAVQLHGWDGNPDHPGLPKLRDKLRLVVPERAAKRPLKFAVRDIEVHSPTFFFSVSSHETRLAPIEAIKALALFGAEAILVSAYDVFNSQAAATFSKALKRAQANGTRILLDSGNYEASRKSDKTWKASKFHRVLKTTPHDFAFCFDELDPPNNRDRMVRQIAAAVERDSKFTSKTVLPIVHAPKSKDGKYNLEHIPYVIRKLAEALAPPVIAIPERELGPGLIAKARTLASIRTQLATLGRYQPLHLLGTGNPLSIAVLSAVGADCFDGLEWCRVVADAANNTLFHFEQYDFFSYQTRVAQSPIVRDAVNSDKINYAGKVLFHNMDYFAQFLGDLRSATHGGKLVRFLSERLPVGSMPQLESALPEVF
ncbi:toll/interleukin-1 receptor domain-containing protein [Bradyrhizobium sp. Ai1a-2]|uniref:toll/interleukin-1 receptor domain-containing protein n=1 Tax=Bradyrhizobium sp. Ai1a-2 TaxID=196490 RepID=UPI00041609A3|nr:toll/interleukin-1 receptor domain-containing protein [Bradyrhizobium sp. Ai1a-2]